MPVTLGELANRFGCELIGDGDVVVDNVAGLHNAGPGSLSFLSNPRFKEQLSSTKAAAVILRPEDADGLPAAALLSDNPYAHYALMAAVIHPEPVYEPGKIAGWIAPPRTGLNNNSFDFEYVKFSDDPYARL